MRALANLLMLVIWASVGLADPVRVGIIGRVTGIDPLEVNGLQFDVAPQVPVLSPLGLRRVEDLRIGHTLAITAQDTGQDWKLVRALYFYPLIGPVTKAADGKLEVMGTTVISADPKMFDGIGQGAWVGVSGLWQGDTVLTSRTGAIRATGFAQIAGEYLPGSGDTGPRIGKTSLRGSIPLDAQEGDVWIFTGKPARNSVEIELQSKGQFARAVDIVLAEGYPSGPIASETYGIYGTGLIGRARESEMPDQGGTVLVCAIDGVALRALPQDERLAATVARLGCLEDMPAPDSAPDTMLPPARD